MPTFDDATTTTAPVEEVWKLLYDPSRLIEWWVGIERIESHGTDGKGNVTIWPEGYPDFPMPQNLRTDADGRRVTVSCLVSDLVFAWKRLIERPHRLGPRAPHLLQVHAQRDRLEQFDREQRNARGVRDDAAGPALEDDGRPGALGAKGLIRPLESANGGVEVSAHLRIAGVAEFDEDVIDGTALGQALAGVITISDHQLQQVTKLGRGRLHRREARKETGFRLCRVTFVRTHPLEASSSVVRGWGPAAPAVSDYHQ